MLLSSDLYFLQIIIHCLLRTDFFLFMIPFYSLEHRYKASSTDNITEKSEPQNLTQNMKQKTSGVSLDLKYICNMTYMNL